MKYFKLFTILVWFLMLQLSCNSQGWVSLKLDSIATLDFPGTPDTSGVEGKEMLLARDTMGGVYSLIKTSIDEGNLNAGFLSIIYVSFVEGIKKSEDVHEVVEKDFKVQGLTGKEVQYKIIKPGDEPITATTRAIYINGFLYAYTSASSDTTGAHAVYSKKFMESFKINAGIPLKQPTSLTDSLMKLAKPAIYVVVFIVIVLIGIGLYSRFKPKRNLSGHNEKGGFS
jgi:hypothetical protein